MCLDKSRSAAWVDGLERKQAVRRASNPADGRSTFIQVTRGCTSLRTVEADIVAENARVLSGFNGCSHCAARRTDRAWHGGAWPDIVALTTNSLRLRWSTRSCENRACGTPAGVVGTALLIVPSFPRRSSRKPSGSVRPYASPTSPLDEEKRSSSRPGYIRHLAWHQQARDPWVWYGWSIGPVIDTGGSSTRPLAIRPRA